MTAKRLSIEALDGGFVVSDYSDYGSLSNRAIVPTFGALVKLIISRWSDIDLHAQAELLALLLVLQREAEAKAVAAAGAAAPVDADGKPIPF